MASTLLGIWGVGMPEMLVILVVVLLLFGSAKIPQLMRGMGQGIGEFKKGLKEGDVEPPKPPDAPATPPEPDKDKK